jgi:hypothetical protein
MNDTSVTAMVAAPKFVGGPPRAHRVPLTYPIEYGGIIYEEIVVARLTAREVADFQDAAAKFVEGAPFVWPIYRDADGKPVPVEALDGLDDDDRLELDKAVRDFLPRRFQGALANVSAPPVGDSTASP